MGPEGTRKPGDHKTAAAKEAETLDGLAALEPIEAPAGGFRNLIGKENGEWAAGPSLLAHAVIWILIVAVLSAVIAFVRG